MVQVEFGEWLRRRAKWLSAKIPHFGKSPDRIFVAGGCFVRRDLSDIDVFPKESRWPEGMVPGEHPILSVTENAITVLGTDKRTPVQFCNYVYPTLRDLVESFDYSHIQAGAELEWTENGWRVCGTWWSGECIDARCAADSVYLKSCYPLSSLVRLLRYYDRGDITKHNAIRSLIRVLSDIIERGFYDREDFKDQLDAVDLGLLSEEQSEMRHGELMRLFELLDQGAAEKGRA